MAPCTAFPVLIKDNIDTADKMATTAGSLALVGTKPPQGLLRRPTTAEGWRSHPGQNEP